MLVAIVGTRQGPDATASVVSDAVAESQALVAAASLREVDATQLDGATASTLAEDLERRIPLPSGGNFGGIRWSDLDGAISSHDVQVVVEYNAACQWFRALRDGRRANDARRIVADIPAWQATRGQPTAEIAAAVAADVASGGGQVLDGVLRDCDAAHEREVKYSREHGTTPSR
jgi:hypothetical protein